MEKHNKNIPYITSDDLVILFDGVCKLCNAWARFIIRHDKEAIIKFVSMQSEKGEVILEYLDQPLIDYETMLFIKNNHIYEKSTAFFKIIQHLPFPIKSLIIFKYVPKSILDFFYDQIAKNRYKLFGKYEKCTLPTSEKENRFL